MSASAPPCRRASASRSMSRAPLPRSTISAAAAPPGTSSPARTMPAALNFSKEQHPRARPALRDRQRVRRRGARPLGLPGTTARSSPTRRPASSSTSRKVRPLDHKGRFFSVKGPLNIERCPQGHPIIIQAGGSPPGQELSARSADLVFSVVNGDTALGQGRLRQPQAARRQARPRAGRARRSCPASCRSSARPTSRPRSSSPACKAG